MPKSQTAPPKQISDNEILALYEEVLPLLYDNPKGLRITNEINKRLTKIVQFDFLHYMMEDPSPSRSHGLLEASITTWGRLAADKKAPKVSIVPWGSADADTRFEAQLEKNHRQALELASVNYPTERPYHYHRIISRTYPRIAIGFFRIAPRNKDTRFTRGELLRFRQLRPHVLRLFRIALNQTYHSQAFQYFDSFAAIGSRIATDHGLSEAELKILPDILFGFNNEEIARKHFVSVATIKTHINHILKKTGTKNRADFLSKFFTSPEHVQL